MNAYEERSVVEFDSGRPDGKLTGLDLLMTVVRDIDAIQTDSDAFDPQLLHQFAKFKRFFLGGSFLWVPHPRKHAGYGPDQLTRATFDQEMEASWA